MRVREIKREREEGGIEKERRINRQRQNKANNENVPTICISTPHQYRHAIIPKNN